MIEDEFCQEEIKKAIDCKVSSNDYQIKEMLFAIAAMMYNDRFYKIELQHDGGEMDVATDKESIDKEERKTVTLEVAFVRKTKKGKYYVDHFPLEVVSFNDDGTLTVLRPSEQIRKNQEREG